MAAIPLKLYFPSRKVQVGVAARSLHHLRELMGTKFGVTGSFKLTLEDGTIVCDPEYFNLLAHQTKITVLELNAVARTKTDGKLVIILKCYSSSVTTIHSLIIIEFCRWIA